MHHEFRGERVRRYTVQVGHYKVQVEGAGVPEALREARKRLAAELPRLWDVIHELDESRFDIACEG